MVNQGGPVLVGGIGLPWLQDLDFAMHFVRSIEGVEWPEDVLVEDLSFPANQVLDRLLEIKPSRVVLVVSMLRDVDPPGTVRRSTLDLTPPPDAEVHQALVESVTLGIVDVEHILAVLRYWKALPEGTTIIEVEPGHHSFGLEGADDIEEPVDKVLALVQDELVKLGPPLTH